MRRTESAAVSATGAVENPESPWVMVCHGGMTLFVNQETGAPTLKVPAEGFKGAHMVQEAEQFQQLAQQAKKYDDGVYSAESRWFKLTQAGRIVYFNKDTMLTSAVCCCPRVHRKIKQGKTLW